MRNTSMRLTSTGKLPRRKSWAAWAGAGFGCLVLAAGCGGGGAASSSLGDPAPGGPSPLKDLASAKVTVDAKTGAVSVENLTNSDGRAAFSPGAVSVRASILSDEPGSTGRRLLNLYLTNNTSEDLGEPDGVRATLSGFENLAASPSDVSSLTEVTTIAGNDTPGTGDGAASGSVLQDATAVTSDENGIYFTTLDGRVKKLAHGQVMTLATGLLNPQGIVASGSGIDALFVSDTGRHRIVRIPTNGGTPVHVSGSTASLVGDALGAATVARYSSPRGLAILGFRGASGLSEYRLFVADSGNSKVKVIKDPFGAASAVSSGATTGQPQSLAVGYIGNGYTLFATTSTHRIQATAADEILSSLTTIAGTGAAGSAEGVGTAASFNNPAGIALTRDALFVADFSNGRIRQMLLQNGGAPISPGSWRVSRLAGTNKAAALDGSGSVAAFDNLTGLAYVEGTGLVAGDTHRIRQITAPSLPIQVGNDGGNASSAKVSVANADGFSAPGRPYFYTKYRVESAGTVGPIAFVVPDGVRLFQFNVTVEGALSYPGALDAQPGGGSDRVLATRIAGDGTSAYLDGMGVGAKFHSIRGMHLTADGVLYIADRGNHTIRRMTSHGEVTTVIGSPSKNVGVLPGTGVVASLASPNAVWMNDQETEGFAVTDTQVVRLTRNGDPKQIGSWTLSVVAGTTAGIVEGVGSTARFNGLRDIMRVSDTELLLCDMVNGRIRRMVQTGADRGLAASWTFSTFVSAMAKPVNILRTMEGVMFVSAEAGAVYRVIPAGSYTVYAGSTTLNGYINGARQNARFNSSVAGLTADEAGHLYLGETGSGRIRRISLNSEMVATVLKGGPSAVEGRGSEASLGGGVTMLERMADGDLYASDGASIWTVRRIVGP